jgi:hypothetical protein
VDGLALDDASARHPISVDGLSSDERLGRRTREVAILGDHSKDVAIDAEDQGIAGLTQPRCVLTYSIEDGLDVCR